MCVIVNQKPFCHQWSVRSHIYFYSRISCLVTSKSINSCSLENFILICNHFSSSNKRSVFMDVLLNYMCYAYCYNIIYYLKV